MAEDLDSGSADIGEIYKLWNMASAPVSRRKMAGFLGICMTHFMAAQAFKMDNRMEYRI